MKTFLQLCKKYLLETEFKIEPYSYVDYFLHKKNCCWQKIKIHIKLLSAFDSLSLYNIQDQKIQI